MNNQNLKPYPAYKPSGIPWLGDIPAHWEVKRVKHLAWFKYGESLSSDVREMGEVPVYGSNGQVDTHSIPNTNGPCLIIGRKGSFGKVNYSSVGCFAIDTTYYIDDTTTKCDLRWLFYCLSIIGLDSFSQDTGVPGLSRELAHNMWLPNISLPEQQAIAAYLDGETARLDALADRYRRLLALLDEKRRALITHAVTRGLNPTAPLKDSGIEWLGQIPAHWELLKTKYLFRLTCEKAPDNNDYELLSLYTEIGVEPRKDLEPKGNKASTTDGYWLVQKGDIVVNKLLAWMGAIGASQYDGVTSPAYDILRKTRNLNSIYYHFLFRSGICYPEFRRRSHGIMDMRLRLYFDDFGQIILPFPPIHEQNMIAEYLDHETARLDGLKTKIETLLARLAEYRAALISAAVTGKIDVTQIHQELA